MLLTRGLAGPFGLGVTPIQAGGGGGLTPVSQGGMPASWQAANAFQPKPDGYDRGSIWTITRNYKNLLRAQVQNTKDILTQWFQSGMLPLCWGQVDSPFGANLAMQGKSPMACKADGNMAKGKPGCEGSAWPTDADTKANGGTGPLNAEDQLTPPCNRWNAIDWGYFQRSVRVYDQQLIEPIGAVTVLGLAFTLDQFNPDKSSNTLTSATYTPTEDQRFLADRAIYMRSQIMMSETFGRTIAPGDNAGANAQTGVSAAFALEYYVANSELDPDRSIVGAIAKGHYGYMRLSGGGMSINQFIALMASNNAAGWTYKIPGYSFNPLSPTDDELNQTGGLVAYYARGGFLLYGPCAQGKVLVEPIPLMRINTGFCWCDKSWFKKGNYETTKWNQNDIGYKIWTITPEDGAPVPVAQKMPGGETDQQFVYIAINTDGSYTMTIKAMSSSALTKAADFIHDLFVWLSKVLCAVAPAATSFNKSLLTEACVDSSGNPCKKGASGCICSPPTNGQKDAVAVANAGIKLFCKEVVGQNLPPMAPPIMPTKQSDMTPFLLISAAVVGGYLLSRK